MPETITPLVPMTAAWVDSLTWDELADEHAKLAHDPAQQARLEGLVEDREERARNRTRPAKKLTPNQWVRQQFDEYLAAQYDRAMIATNGQMLSARGSAAHIDSRSLMEGPVSRVKKYGSDELNGFFGQNGRHTFMSFRYSLLKWPSDRKAYEYAMSQDFGHVPHVEQHQY